MGHFFLHETKVQIYNSTNNELLGVATYNLQLTNYRIISKKEANFFCKMIVSTTKPMLIFEVCTLWQLSIVEDNNGNIYCIPLNKTPNGSYTKNNKSAASKTFLTIPQPSNTFASNISFEGEMRCKSFCNFILVHNPNPSRIRCYEDMHKME